MQDRKFFPQDSTAIVVLLAAAAFFSVVRIYPIADALRLSLQYKTGAQEYSMGLGNFRTLLSDTIFLQSVWNSFRYTAMAVPGVLVVGLTLALLVNNVKNTFWRGVFTGSFFLAYVVPLVAVAVMWRYMYLPSRMGLFNALLDLVNLVPLDGWTAYRPPCHRLPLLEYGNILAMQWFSFSQDFRPFQRLFTRQP